MRITDEQKQAAVFVCYPKAKQIIDINNLK